jgi:putative molybdopterin biosynthesis protein
MKQNFRVDEAAIYLNTSKRTIYRLIAEGELAAFRVRKTLRVRAEDLRKYVQREATKVEQENC